MKEAESKTKKSSKDLKTAVLANSSFSCRWCDNAQHQQKLTPFLLKLEKQKCPRCTLFPNVPDLRAVNGFREQQLVNCDIEALAKAIGRDVFDGLFSEVIPWCDITDFEGMCSVQEQQFTFQNFMKAERWFYKPWINQAYLPCLKRQLKEKVNPKAELKVNEANFFVLDLHDGLGNDIIPEGTKAKITTPLYTDQNYDKDAQLMCELFGRLMKNKDRKLDSYQKKLFDHYLKTHLDDMMLATQKEDQRPSEKAIASGKKTSTAETEKEGGGKRERKKNEKYTGDDFVDDVAKVSKQPIKGKPKAEGGRGRPSKKKKDEEEEQDEAEEKIDEVKPTEPKKNKEKQLKPSKSPKDAEWQETHAACCGELFDQEGNTRATFGCEQCEHWTHLDCQDFSVMKELTDKSEQGSEKAKDQIQAMYDMINEEWDAFYCKECCKLKKADFDEQKGTYWPEHADRKNEQE